MYGGRELRRLHPTCTYYEPQGNPHRRWFVFLIPYRGTNLFVFSSFFRMWLLGHCFEIWPSISLAGLREWVPSSLGASNSQPPSWIRQVEGWPSPIILIWSLKLWVRATASPSCFQVILITHLLRCQFLQKQVKQLESLTWASVPYLHLVKTVRHQCPTQPTTLCHPRRSFY